MHPNVHSCTIYNSQVLEATQVPISKWVYQNTVVHLHNGMLCHRKKEGAPTLCDSVDGTVEHYAKWNKPGSEGQIPYDLTFNWNMINKRKKQTKYNQRHWNKEQTDIKQWGLGRQVTRWGKKGKGRQPTNLKDPWTKPRRGKIEYKRWGWVSGGEWWWREIGDNCSWYHF